MGKASIAFGLAAVLMGSGIDNAMAQPAITDKVRDDLDCVGAVAVTQSHPKFSQELTDYYKVSLNDVRLHYVNIVLDELGGKSGAEKIAAVKGRFRKFIADRDVTDEVKNIAERCIKDKSYPVPAVELFKQEGLSQQVQDDLNCLGALAVNASMPELNGAFARRYKVQAIQVMQHFMSKVTNSLGEKAADQPMLNAAKRYNEMLYQYRGADTIVMKTDICVKYSSYRAPK